MAKIEVDEDQLNTLITKNETQRDEIKQLYDASIKILEMLGLAENGKAKTACFSGEENAMPHIIKGAGSLFTKLTQSQIPIIGKAAQKELEERFAFFGTLVPVFEKYGKEFYNNGK